MIRGEEEPYSRRKVDVLRDAFTKALPFLAPEAKVTVELESVRLQMLRVFARSIGIDLSRLTAREPVKPVEILYLCFWFDALNSPAPKKLGEFILY